MEWQAVVLAIQILLLAAGWLLFQRARGELSAQAADAPVLAEAKLLQQQVKLLLAELGSATDRQALHLENGCADAVAVLTELERKIQTVEVLLSRCEAVSRSAVEASSACRQRTSDLIVREGPESVPQGVVVDSRLLATELQGIGSDAANSDGAAEGARENSLRNEEIYTLADRGQTTASIAHKMRLSEGEVEIVLGLRGRR
jgi:hypothetical protein